MKKTGIILVLLLVLAPLKSQHLIGLPREKAEVAIKSYYPTFVKDNSFVNHTYHYLKFTDRVSDQTLLVFLSDQDICTSTKLICDYSLLNSTKLKLKKYKSAGKDKWVYKQDGIDYIIRLNREAWFFSLFTSKK